MSDLLFAQFKTTKRFIRGGRFILESFFSFLIHDFEKNEEERFSEKVKQNHLEIIYWLNFYRCY